MRIHTPADTACPDTAQPGYPAATPAPASPVGWRIDIVRADASSYLPMSRATHLANGTASSAGTAHTGSMDSTGIRWTTLLTNPIYEPSDSSMTYNTDACTFDDSAPDNTYLTFDSLIYDSLNNTPTDSLTFDTDSTSDDITSDNTCLTFDSLTYDSTTCDSTTYDSISDNSTTYDSMTQGTTSSSTTSQDVTHSTASDSTGFDGTFNNLDADSSNVDSAVVCFRDEFIYQDFWEAHTTLPQRITASRLEGGLDAASHVMWVWEEYVWMFLARKSVLRSTLACLQATGTWRSC